MLLGFINDPTQKQKFGAREVAARETAAAIDENQKQKRPNKLKIQYAANQNCKATQSSWERKLIWNEKISVCGRRLPSH
jgi:hypothetical protein